MKITTTNPYVDAVTRILQLQQEAEHIYNSLKNNSYTVYKLNGCGHCTRLMSLLQPYMESGKITIKDVQDEGVQEEIQKMSENEETKIQGFPTAFRSDGKKCVGSRGSVYDWLMAFE